MKTNNYKYFYIILLCFLCASVVNTHSQTPKTWEWVRHIGSPGWDVTAGAVSDAKNNLYIAGTYSDSLICGKKGSTSKGNTDMFVARFTEKGKPDGLFTFGGPGTDKISCLAITPGEQLILGGAITSGIANGALSYNGAQEALYVAGMNAKGEILWATLVKVYGKASLYLLGTTPGGSITACGHFTDSLSTEKQSVVSKGKSDIFILNISPTGEIQNLNSIGGEGDDRPEAMEVSSSGKITLVIRYAKEIALGNTQISGNPGKKVHQALLTLTPELKPEWTIPIQPQDYCSITTIKTNKNGSIYLSGSFNQSVTLGDTLIKTNGLSDAFIAKISGEGKMVWAKNIGSVHYDYGNQLNIDNLGGLLLTGSIGDTVQIDSVSINPPTEGGIAFVAQFDENGRATWGDYISAAGRNFSEYALLDKMGNLYLYGSFVKTFSKEEEEMKSYGYHDLFLARYYNCPGSKAEVIGDRYFCPGQGTELKVKNTFKNVLWNDSIAGRHYYTSTPGRYWVSMYDKKGCLYTDTFAVTVAPVPWFSLGEDTLLMVSDTLMLKAPVEYMYYRWHDRTTGPEYQVLAPDNKPCTQTCTLMVTDSLGCMFTDSIEVTFAEPREVSAFDRITLTTYPNPATDVLNWYIDTEKPIRMNMEIADENGRILIKQKIGTYYPGQILHTGIAQLSPGTYYLKLTNSGGAVIKTTGFVKQ